MVDLTILSKLYKHKKNNKEVGKEESKQNCNTKSTKNEYLLQRAS